MMNPTTQTPNNLPDSVSDLLALQRFLITELNERNVTYCHSDRELSLLRKQNNVLKSQIDYLYEMMDRLCSDRHLDNEIGSLGIA